MSETAWYSVDGLEDRHIEPAGMTILLQLYWIRKCDEMLLMFYLWGCEMLWKNIKMHGGTGGGVGGNVGGGELDPLEVK